MSEDYQLVGMSEKTLTFTYYNGSRGSNYLEVGIEKQINTSFSIRYHLTNGWIFHLHHNGKQQIIYPFKEDENKILVYLFQYNAYPISKTLTQVDSGLINLQKLRNIDLDSNLINPQELQKLQILDLTGLMNQQKFKLDKKSKYPKSQNNKPYINNRKDIKTRYNIQQM